MSFLSNFKSSSKTKFYHRRLGHLLRIKREPAGARNEPVLVVLDAMADKVPSDKPPVRIFVGSESAQHRAERIFVWSILKVRDPSRRYEIYLMKDLKGFNRDDWKTGFTYYRYLVPEFAGHTGRAIYNDVDQIYLSDPAELFDTDMQGSAQMSITEKETSVMLLDCARMASLWHREAAERGKRHSYFRDKLQGGDGLWRPLAATWHARDDQYVPGVSKLLHFTTQQTQPWSPFSKDVRYQPRPHAETWLALECEADAAGFTIFTEAHPSQRYLKLIEMYKTMHAEGSPEKGRPPEKTFPGISLLEHVAPIAALVESTGAKTILDYGAGKGRLYSPYPGEPEDSRFKSMAGWDGVKVTCYDPGYTPFSGPIEPAYDGVISTDVVEHITEEDIPWVLDKLFQHAQRFVYVVAACYPAKRHLPDGQNAHCTVQPPEWWRDQMEGAARRHPGLQWQLCAQLKDNGINDDKIFKSS